MHYYQHNIGDYRRDTVHLSLLEHGIYRQMLDQYYLNEGALAYDEAKLMRSLCVRTADEMQAFRNVCADFFEVSEGMLTHKRCDQEISAICSKSDKARDSANARWARHRCESMRPHNDGNAEAMLPNNPLPNNPEREEKTPPLPPTPISRHAELAILFRDRGVSITPANPHLCQWVNSEITDLEATEAIARARLYKPEGEQIAAGYLAKIVSEVISERASRQEKTPEAAKPIPGSGASTSTQKRVNYGRPSIEEQNRAAAAEAKRKLFGESDCIEGEVIRG
jgi:uncharacterized protein YdaU (DUF1376 family)